MDQGQHRTAPIVVETVHHRISGLLTLARDGYRSRVSDLINASERDFVSLVDATVEPLDGGPSTTHAYLAVGRRHIVLVVTDTEM